MFEKHKYKILATVLILVILGAGTFYYLKKKREKKEAEEKAALAKAQKEKPAITISDSIKEAPKVTPKIPQKQVSQVAGNSNSNSLQPV